jgi:hypothetical protein
MITDEQGGSRPVPDPTVRTMEALFQSISSLKELFRTEIDAQKEAVKLLQQNADKSPVIAVVNQDLSSFKEFVAKQFSERDIRSERDAKATETAINAALQAQKEAAGKSEGQFAKLLDQQAMMLDSMKSSLDERITQQATLIGAVKTGLDEKIDDVKSRYTSFEGRVKGIGDSWGWLVGIIGLVAAVIPTVILLIK